MCRWMSLMILALVLQLQAQVAICENRKLGGGSLRSKVVNDPDSTCQEAYRKNQTEDACLASNDHFGRPCEYCLDKNLTYCYNADQARWAKFFGDKCSVRPDRVDGPSLS